MLQPIDYYPDPHQHQRERLNPFRDTCYSRELRVVRTQIHDRFVRNQQDRLTASRQDSLNNFRAQQKSVTESPDVIRLAGKSEIERKLKYELQRAKRYRRCLALLVVKIDNQDQLENQLSSMILDDLFAVLGEIAVSTMREIDTVARPSREFLAICCPETGLENACFAANRLREALYRQSAKPLFGSARLTVSIGVAVAPEHSKDADGLIRSAVTACLAAAGNGGNRVLTATDASNSTAEPPRPVVGPLLS